MAVGIAFYARFALALVGDLKSSWTRYFTWLEAGALEYRERLPEDPEPMIDQAVWKGSELGGNIVMWTQGVSPEQLAQLFHHYHQALAAPSAFGGRRESESWEDCRRLRSSARLKQPV